MIHRKKDHRNNRHRKKIHENSILYCSSKFDFLIFNCLLKTIFSIFLIIIYIYMYMFIFAEVKHTVFKLLLKILKLTLIK